MLHAQNLDRLMQGIKSIISENRCSLSKEELKLLEEAITFLETVKNTNDLKSPVSLDIITRVIKILLKVLLSDNFHKIKDLFS